MAEEKEKQHPAKIQKRIEVFDLLEAKQIAPKEAARQINYPEASLGVLLEKC